MRKISAYLSTYPSLQAERDPEATFPFFLVLTFTLNLRRGSRNSPEAGDLGVGKEEAEFGTQNMPLEIFIILSWLF